MSERIDLLENGLRLIQDPEGFCYGTDAVVLAHFVVAKPADRLIDLCTGTGIVPLLLSTLTRCNSMYGVELQQKVFELAQRNVELNGLDEKVRILRDDIKNLPARFMSGEFDVVTCNPPYMIQNSGKVNMADTKTIARHEVACTLEDVVKTAACLLKNGGRFYLVHRPERLADALNLMRQYRLEPKRLQFIHSDYKKAPSLFVTEGKKERRSGLIIEPPVCLNDNGGKA